MAATSGPIMESYTLDNLDEQWVEIEDPVSGNIFYAKPSTGECSWEKPLNANIKPRDPAGEWWELFDETHGLPYYYNTFTGQTDWIRPEVGTIIPLHALQNSTIGQRVSMIITNRASMVLSNHDVDAGRLEQMYGEHQHTNDGQQRQSIYQMASAKHQYNDTSSAVDEDAVSQYSQQHDIPQISCSVVDEEPSHHAPSMTSSAQSSRNPQSMRSLRAISHQPEPVTTDTTRSYGTLSSESRTRNMVRSASAVNLNSASHGMTGTSSTGHYSKPLHATTSVVEFVRETSDDPILAGADSESGFPTSDGRGDEQNLLQPGIGVGQSRTSLPTDLRDDPSMQFQIDGFARKHFAIHKKGIFRRKVPVEKMLQWTKESLKLPLLTLNKNVHRDALKIFKIIQRIMGDRPRIRGSSNLDDIQWLLERGLQHQELRDEIYVQVCKQVTNNPNRASTFKGWELMSVLCVTFPPSKNFEDYLKNFIQQHTNEPDRIDILARHCYKKLIRILSSGPRGKVPTFGEIEHAKAAAFNPSVFGETLETIMSMQAKDFPDLEIPRILAFLVESILEMDGESSEGIFRVPGDVDYVTNLRLRIENNNYDMSGIRDPNVPASTLKFWLRDLADPLIPGEFYRECITHSEDPQAAFDIISRLPEVNRHVVEYLVGFLQVFARPECVARTKMHIDNLSMVFAPSFLRCPTSNLTQIFENTRHEQAFVKTLIVHLPCQPPPVRQAKA